MVAPCPTFKYAPERSWLLDRCSTKTNEIIVFLPHLDMLELKANILSSFISFSERFYSQFLRQMVTRLLDTTTTSLLESSNLSITQRDQIHHNQTHWALPIQVCSQWQITCYHRSKKWTISLDIDADYLNCCSMFSS